MCTNIVSLRWIRFVNCLKIHNACWSACTPHTSFQLIYWMVTINWWINKLHANCYLPLFHSLFLCLPWHRIVCHCRSGGHINPRRLPQLDQNEISVSRAAGANCCLHIISIWFAKFNSGRHLLFPIDRPLCRIDFDHVLGILSNHCHRMVLWHSPPIQKY